MPDRRAPSPTKRSLKRSSADVDLLVPEWRQALDLLERATEASLEELGALREQLAGSLRSMRETRYWDAARSEEAVERLTISLQAAERRLADQAEGLGERQADAMEYAATIAQRLASALERLSPGTGAGGTGTPVDLDLLVADVRDAVARDLGGVSRKLASSVAKRLGEIERRLGQATSEAASAGQEAAEKALDEVRASFGELGDSLEELRKINEESRQAAEDASAPVRHALDELKGSLGEMSSAVGRDLAERVTELRTGQAAVERLAESMHGEMQGIGDRFRELVDERLTERLSGPLSTFAERLSALEGRLDHATSASGSVERGMEALRESIHRIATSAGREVADLQSRVAALGEQAERLSGIEEVVGGRLVELGQDVQAKLDALGKDLQGRTDTLASELGVLGRRLGDEVTALRTAMASELAKVRVQLPGEVGTLVEASEGRTAARLVDGVAGLEARLASSSERLIGELQAEITRHHEQTEDRLGELVAASDARSASREEDLDRRLSDRFAAMEVQDARRDDALRDRDQGFRSSLAALHQATEEGSGRVDAAVAAAAEEVRALGARLEAETASLHQELAAERDRMASATKRVDRVAEAIESLGRRRGFRELVETEQAMQQEQAAFVERLSDTADHLGSVLREAEARIAAAVTSAAGELRDPETKAVLGRVAAAVSGIQEQLPAALEGMTTEMRSELGRTDQSKRGLAELGEGLEAHLARVEAALDEGLRGLGAKMAKLRPAPNDDRSTAATRELAKATTAVRAELKALRGRIESWGKPRTAPRLAQEVTELSARFDALERAVEETLAASVARKVHASVDRRLRAALAQITERNQPDDVEAVPPPEPSNGPAAAAEAAPGRPRRFRRTGG